MKKLIILLSILWSAAAQAQWQVPLNTVPIGRGPGVQGFNSVANTGTGALCLVDTTPPSFKACFGAAAFGNPTAVAGPTANNGVAGTAMRSDASPAIQLGTNSVMGLVQGDGTKLSCTAGVCTAVVNGIFPTPTRAGDVVYWNGTTWVTIAGNNSGTNVLTENASGVPTWAAAGAGNVSSSGTPTANQIAQWTNSSTIQGITIVPPLAGGTGVASPTAHTIPINQGASAQANTGTGTAGQQLTSNGTSADPSFQSGGWVLLNTLTASNSATLADTTSITATYSQYEIVFSNIIPATNTTNLVLQVHASAAFQNTGYVTSSISSNAGGSFSGGSALTTGITLLSAQGNAAPGISGSISVYSPTGTSAAKQWNGTFSGNTTTPGALFGVSAGYWSSTTALDGFQVSMSSGNITSGAIKIYGRL